MKKGDTVKLYFRCAGVVSEENRTVRTVTKDCITTDETLHPDKGGEEYEKFDRKTGKCLNDNTMFGGSRRIDPC